MMLHHLLAIWCVKLEPMGQTAMPRAVDNTTTTTCTKCEALPAIWPSDPRRSLQRQVARASSLPEARCAVGGGRRPRGRIAQGLTQHHSKCSHISIHEGP